MKNKDFEIIHNNIYTAVITNVYISTLGLDKKIYISLDVFSDGLKKYASDFVCANENYYKKIKAIYASMGIYDYNYQEDLKNDFQNWIGKPFRLLFKKAYNGVKPYMYIAKGSEVNDIYTSDVKGFSGFTSDILEREKENKEQMKQSGYFSLEEIKEEEEKEKTNNNNADFLRYVENQVEKITRKGA